MHSRTRPGPHTRALFLSVCVCVCVCVCLSLSVCVSLYTACLRYASPSRSSVASGTSPTGLTTRMTKTYAISRSRPTIWCVSDVCARTRRRAGLQAAAEACTLTRTHPTQPRSHAATFARLHTQTVRKSDRQTHSRRHACTRMPAGVHGCRTALGLHTNFSQLQVGCIECNRKLKRPTKLSECQCCNPKWVPDQCICGKDTTAETEKMGDDCTCGRCVRDRG